MEKEWPCRNGAGVSWAMRMAAMGLGLALGWGVPAYADEAAGEAAPATQTAPTQAELNLLKRPPAGTVVTDNSPEFLKPTPTLRPGVAIAKTPPVVDFLIYPGSEGKGWSNYADGCVANGKYYSGIGDHGKPKGTGMVFEYDPASKRIRKLVDIRQFLEESGAVPEGMNYTPGKIHSRIQMGSDGWLYYSTHRGSPSTTNNEHGYKGDWILRTHPGTGKTEVVAAFPIPLHCIPASTLDAERMIFYGGTAPGRDSRGQAIIFFAYDLNNRKILKAAPDGFDRYAIFSSSTGKVFWKPLEKEVKIHPITTEKDATTISRVYDPVTNTISDMPGIPHVRCATTETAEGWVYGTSHRDCTMWGFNVKTGQVIEVGDGAVGTGTYTASMEVDPTGSYLYYVTGAHGTGTGDGTPIIQYDIKNRKAKVIAFLRSYYTEKYGYTPGSTFGTALDEKGETFFVTWGRGMMAIHIPESERLPWKPAGRR